MKRKERVTHLSGGEEGDMDTPLPLLGHCQLGKEVKERGREGETILRILARGKRGLGVKKVKAVNYCFPIFKKQKNSILLWFFVVLKEGELRVVDLSHTNMCFQQNASTHNAERKVYKP